MWEEVETISYGQSYLQSKMLHIPTGYWFIFTAGRSGGGSVNLGAKFSPPARNGSSYLPANDQDVQMDYCLVWLRTVKAEHEAVDLWAALKDESRLIVGEVVDEPDEKFTQAEVEMLRLRLDDIKAYLLEHVPAATPAQVVYVNTTFNYVAESAERLTKKEWKAIFVSAIVTQVLALALTPQTIHGIWSLAAHLILPLLGNLQLPPLPPTP